MFLIFLIKLRLIRLAVEINQYLVFEHLNRYGLKSVDCTQFFFEKCNINKKFNWANWAKL